MISDYLTIVSVVALAASWAAYLWSMHTCVPNALRGAVCAFSGAFALVMSSWAFFTTSMLAIVLVALSLWTCLTGCRLIYEHFTDQ